MVVLPPTIRVESWRSARDQGAHAAAAMLGATAASTRMLWFWLDQYELGLQVAGLSDPTLPVTARTLGEGAEILVQLDRYGGVVSASGLGPGQAVAKDIRLFEMMIERRIWLEPALAADPATNLKKMLRT
jgi:3-phenylpropionate/trans-cinnamate dioxygenase ferredoxin reductase subunit